MRGAVLVIIIALELHNFAGTPRECDSSMKNIFLSGRRCAELAFGVVGFFGIHFGHAQAATINAASPSLADVTTAIASAVDGDTVIVPAGTASWTTGLVITKGITLMGQTTTNPVAKTANDQTIILDDVVRGSGGTPIIWVQVAAGKSYRVSGITFRQGANTDVNYNGAIKIIGDTGSHSQAVRLDHCHFDDLAYQNVAVESATYSVIDHNIFDTRTIGRQSVFCSRMGTYWGDEQWTLPAYFGSDQFVFIEDNCFNNTIATGYGGGLDGRQGGKWVFRHNHIYNCDGIVGSHGTEIGRYRGVRAVESYNNDFHYTFVGFTNVGAIRSGGFLTHDNTFDGTRPGFSIALTQYRVFFHVPVFNGSWGDNPWDVNVTEADGTHVDGHSPYLFDSGTATAGSTSTITDTTKTWTTDHWIGYAAKRPLDGGIMIITSNTSTVLTGYYMAGYGGGTTWAVGDSYQIHRVLISQDQPCRGAGDLITSTTEFNPVNSTTGTPSWTHQALEPVYSWNDRYTPDNSLVNIITGPGAFAVLQAGRDYFNNTPMPGYTPYTYPHPLVSGAPPPPQHLVILPP
jgi:hypothetical protein